MGEEKRRRTRVAVELPGCITVGDTTHDVTTKVLSLKGVLCSPQNPKFTTGTACRFCMQFTEKYYACVNCTVVSNSDLGIALEFKEMDQESFMHLRRIVQLHLGDSDKIDHELIIPAFDD